MAVRIRLRRIGKKKQPQYRVVAAEAAGPRDGRFIEVIGHYNPRAHPSAMSVNEERALWWLRQGAQPSEPVKVILVKTGVWEKFGGKATSGPPAAVPEPAGEQEAKETGGEEEAGEAAV